MDCSKTEPLLSLYVAGDLENSLLSAVSLHLRSCHLCSRLADEYTESRQWLRSSYAPPDFDCTFYDEVRSAVLEEINRSASARSSFWQLPFQLFRRRLTLAAPVVLLLAAGALAIYVASDRTKLGARHDRLAAVDTKQTENSVDAEGEATQRGESQPSRAPLPAASPPRRTSGISTARKTAKRNAPHAEASLAAARALPTSSAAQLSVAPAEQRVDKEAIASTADAAINQEATRIEIQTSDPNIRIIWFSPKGTE